MRKKQNTQNLAQHRERSILLGYAVQKKGLDGRVQIGIRWARLIVTFVLLAFVGWFSMGAALYLYFKYEKEFDEVSYIKMLTVLPFSMDDHRKEMGDYHVQRGLEELKAGNYRDSLRLLRLGVRRSPGNLEGRSVLAEFYEVALKRPDIAADQMLKGINRGGIDDLDYLKRTIRLLLRYQMDSEIQSLADRYLPDTPELTERNRTLAFGASKASHFRGNYDRADDYLMSYRLTNSLEGLLLSSEISWDRGDEIAAITKIEASLRNFPNSEPLLMQLSKYHRELGNLDEARRYAILRNVSNPLSPAPRLELLYIYNKSEDKEREKRETQRMLKQFRQDENALQSLAAFAGDTGNVNLARRTYEEALENEFNIDAFALLLIEAHLVDKDYAGALDFAEELLKEKPSWLNERRAAFNSLRAVASYGINRPDLGEIYLQDFVDSEGTQPKTYLAVARRFSNIGRYQQTRKVLLVAYQQEPTNQMILSELIRAELQLGYTENLNNLITRLLQMRRPDIELLVDAYKKLGSDRFIFTPDRESLLLELSAILRENKKEMPTLDS